MVIRNGQVFYDRVPEANRHQFPNLDTLAMLEDGSWHVFHSDEHTAQEYLDMGVTNTFAFGPILVRDGIVDRSLYDKKMLAAVISATRRMSEIVIFKNLCCFMVITFLRETLFQYFTTIKAVVHLL